MDPWKIVLERAWGCLAMPGAGTALFRGQPNVEWTLSPGMARPKWMSEEDREATEYNGFFGFVTAAASFLPDTDPWTVAFAMQHHGLQTRLLDWTHNFGVALYFALKGSEGDSVVWVLNPYELNLATIGRELLLHPTPLNADYRSCFIDRTAPPDGDVVAIVPLRHHPRIISQQSAFTLHSDLSRPLEELHPNVVTKIVIPKAARRDAEVFLQLAGITEFTLFPDLDALARMMRMKFER
jgi:FRG domain